jgi:drug/metabolite transporter (DMT)-like permease
MDLSAAVFAVFLCVLFGANAVAIKISLTGLGVFTTAGIRFGIAAMVIFLWAQLKGKPLQLTTHQLKLMLVLGVIFYFQLSLFYLGLSRTTASHGTLIANILPFVVLVLAHFFIKEERISIKKVVGLIFGFCGVLLLFGDAGHMEKEVMLGDLFVLAAVMIWGCNAIYTKRIIGSFQPFQITLYPLAVAAPLFLVSAVFLDQEMVSYVDASILGSLAYQTFVTASFGLIGWMMMIKRYGATTLHSFIFIMPISGVFFGIVVLGEPLTKNLIGSILLVTVGLIVVNRSPKELGLKQYYHYLFPGKH